ncbi:MAG: 2,3-bisphosphoglycerate-independent phosphoglycerate mutase [Desulfovibrionaceae bacterium]
MTRPTQRKIVFLIADGMGGWPVDALGGQTTLAAARTPHMDALARRGVTGTCRTVPQGMPPGSDVANMALFGFDPATHHTGRGPIEAAAQGLVLDPDDLVWRCNLVTVSEFSSAGLMRDYSSGHIATPAAHALVKDLQENVMAETGGLFTLYPGVQYRHLLVQKGGAAAPEAVLAINPPHDITDKPIADDMAAFAASERLAALLFRAARRLAADANPTRANAIWPWGQGRPLFLPDFQQAFGLKGAVVSAVDLVRGLGRAAGMEVIEVEGVTGLLDTNYAGKVAAAKAFLEDGGDYAYVHLEGPDEAGHGGDPHEKVEAISRFDAQVVAPLVAAFPDAVFVATCDHLTPIAIRTHASDPVPFTVAWPGATPNGAPCLTEASAAATGLHIGTGHDLLPWVLANATT